LVGSLVERLVISFRGLEREFGGENLVSAVLLALHLLLWAIGSKAQASCIEEQGAKEDRFRECIQLEERCKRVHPQLYRER
jgi:hypothetical protein